MKIRQVGAELFHAEERIDGRTDRHDEANSRFSQFCRRPYIVANNSIYRTHFYYTNQMHSI